MPMLGLSLTPAGLANPKGTESNAAEEELSICDTETCESAVKAHEGFALVWWQQKRRRSALQEWRNFSLPALYERMSDIHWKLSWHRRSSARKLRAMRSTLQEWRKFAVPTRDERISGIHWKLHAMRKAWMGWQTGMWSERGCEEQAEEALEEKMSGTEEGCEEQAEEALEEKMSGTEEALEEKMSGTREALEEKMSSIHWKLCAMSKAWGGWQMKVWSEMEREWQAEEAVEWMQGRKMAAAFKDLRKYNHRITQSRGVQQRREGRKKKLEETEARMRSRREAKRKAMQKEVRSYDSQQRSASQEKQKRWKEIDQNSDKLGHRKWIAAVRQACAEEAKENGSSLATELRHVCHVEAVEAEAGESQQESMLRALKEQVEGEAMVSDRVTWNQLISEMRSLTEKSKTDSMARSARARASAELMQEAARWRRRHQATATGQMGEPVSHVAHEVWQKQKFHAVNIPIRFEGSRSDEVAVGDSGAGPSLVSDSMIYVEVLQRTLKPGKARVMQSATTHRIKSRGAATLKFWLGKNRVMFEDEEFQVTTKAKTPTILGVEFWVKYKAKFDFEARVIRMIVKGQAIEIPFTVGDEEEEEEEPTALYLLDDIVVPPRAPAKLRAMPLRGDRQPKNQHEVWQVGPTEEEEALQSIQEEKDKREGTTKSAAVRGSRDETTGRRVRQSRNQWEAERAARESKGGWYHSMPKGGRSGGEKGEESYDAESDGEEPEEEEDRDQHVTSGVALAITSPEWCEEQGTAVLAVNFINTSSEPVVLRKGQRIASAERLKIEDINWTAAASQGEESCEGGTNDSAMSCEEEHRKGDWRRGMTWDEVIQETRQPGLEEKFREWEKNQGSGMKIGEKSSDRVSAEVKEMYRRLLFAYQEIVAENPKKPGIIPGIVHKIVYKQEDWGKPPHREQTRRCSPMENEVKEKEVRVMRQNDIVEPANSPYNNNLVLVKKKDGSLRTCIDFRVLNSRTRFDGFPLNRIDEALDILGKAKRLSVMDNSSAFWSIRLHRDDKEKTAFTTREQGQLQFKRMPFGLTNATATYSRALMHVLRGLVWQRCIVYIDDVVVWGDSMEDHFKSLHDVFKRYSINNVNVKLSKCHFDCSETEFVGHKVEVGKGTRVDPKKVEAIVNMKRPQNVQEIKSFLGMTSYYKRFVPEYAQLALPLRRIENVYKSKMMPLGELWGPLQQKSFEALKLSLVHAPILQFPDFSKPVHSHVGLQHRSQRGSTDADSRWERDANSIHIAGIE